MTASHLASPPMASLRRAPLLAFTMGELYFDHRKAQWWGHRPAMRARCPALWLASDTGTTGWRCGRKWIRFFCCLVVFLFGAMKTISAGLLLIALSTVVVAAPHHGEPRWLGSWASSQMIAEQNSAAPGELIRGGTLRQIVHLSAGGSMVRIRVSNAFGTAPLHLIALHVAHAQAPNASRIDPVSDVAVTFDRRADVFIPAGAEYTSDPVAYQAAPLSDLAVTMQLEEPPERQTGHPGSRATSYLAAGGSVAAAGVPAGARAI